MSALGIVGSIGRMGIIGKNSSFLIVPINTHYPHHYPEYPSTPQTNNRQAAGLPSRQQTKKAAEKSTALSWATWIRTAAIVYLLQSRADTTWRRAQPEQ